LETVQSAEKRETFFSIMIMRIWLPLFLILLFPAAKHAQEKSLRLELLQGMNRTFVGENVSDTKFGYSGAVGISFKYKKKKSAISFEPQLLLTKNSYRFRVNDEYTVKIRQRHLSLMPIAGIAISENVTIRTGLFVNLGDASDVLLVYRANSSYQSVGREELYRSYLPNMVQAGFLVGVSFCLGEKKRWYFNILLQQFGNSFLAADYSLDLHVFNEPAKTSFSSKARPTILLVGFNYTLPKRPKKGEEVIQPGV
jgi:hypothetical protein